MQPVRILVADDHEVVRRGVRSLLNSRTDWEVCGEAVDGREAVEKAKELKPDVIVMDISMPRLNGLEATRVIRKEVPQSEILIFSQHAAAEMRPVALQAGAQDYIAKSAIPNDLLTAVESLSQRVLVSSSSQHHKAFDQTKACAEISSSELALQRLAQEERAWLAAIVESSDDAIISKNLDGI